MCRFGSPHKNTAQIKNLACVILVLIIPLCISKFILEPLRIHKKNDGEIFLFLFLFIYFICFIYFLILKELLLMDEYHLHLQCADNGEISISYVIFHLLLYLFKLIVGLWVYHQTIGNLLNSSAV